MSNSKEPKVNNRNYRLSPPVSFANEPELINPQYKHRSLGELVAMARATGQRPELMPNVTVRKGVYLCGENPQGAIVPPRDKFDLADAVSNSHDSLIDAEKKLAEAEQNVIKEKHSAKDKEIAELRRQLDAAKQSQK